MTERSPKDYAIEHAEYLAKAAERLLDAANTLRALEAGEDVPELGDLQHAEESYSDHYRGLTDAIYEFRKRAARAVAPAPGQGSVRNATDTRAADYILEASNGEIGSGDDPVGFLIASHRSLRALLNTPEIEDFTKAVRLEAAHQIERWGAVDDRAKRPADWFWLVGYLAGKALHSQLAENRPKALHHCISTAAALCNWHAAIKGTDNRMRPGSSDVEKIVEQSFPGETVDAARAGA